MGVVQKLAANEGARFQFSKKLLAVLNRKTIHRYVREHSEVTQFVIEQVRNSMSAE